MNYVALRTMLEAEFGDSGTRFRTLLLKWANAVYHEICAAHDAWSWLQTVKSLTQASGSDSYTPESASPALSVRRVLDMVDVTDSIHRELVFVGEKQFWGQDQVKGLTGLPTMFRMWGNTIYFYPKPDSTRTLQFRYILREPDLNESDNSGQGTTILIPDQDIRVLEQGIHAKAYRWLDDTRYPQAQADYLRMLNDLKTQCGDKGPSVIYKSTSAGTQRTGDTYRVVITP